jgi:hypothetical protein
VGKERVGGIIRVVCGQRDRWSTNERDGWLMIEWVINEIVGLLKRESGG